MKATAPKCHLCKKAPVRVKKWNLCRNCYSKLYQKHKRGTLMVGELTGSNLYGMEFGHGREFEFVRFFFNHKNWLYEPATFKFNGVKYTPDFYDGERNVFIEHIGCRQRFNQNKQKLIKFIKFFPKINFEIRNTKGTLIDPKKGYTDL